MPAGWRDHGFGELIELRSAEDFLRLEGIAGVMRFAAGGRERIGL